MNASISECFINVPVIILIGKYEYPILLNVIFNIGLMFTAAVGNILIIFSFMLVSSMRTTSNYVLYELALTDLCVGLIVHPLYILALYRVNKKKNSWLQNRDCPQHIDDIFCWCLSAIYHLYWDYSGYSSLNLSIAFCKLRSINSGKGLISFSEVRNQK